WRHGSLARDKRQSASAVRPDASIIGTCRAPSQISDECDLAGAIDGRRIKVLEDHARACPRGGRSLPSDERERSATFRPDSKVVAAPTGAAAGHPREECPAAR